MQIAGKIEIIFMVAVLVSLGAVIDVTGADKVQFLDGVAVHVNDTVMTVGDIAEMVAPVTRQLRLTYKGDELKKRLRRAYDGALKSLIARELILEAFEKSDASLPDWIIDRRIEEIIKESCGGDRAVLMTQLVRDRVSMAEFRARVKDGFIVSAMRNENIGQRVKVSPASVRKAYDRDKDKYMLPGKVKLRMIVVSDERGVKQARQQAEDVLKRINAGENFAVTARNVSKGSKAEAGGDWGWIEPEAMLRRELAGIAVALKPGETSGIVEIGNQLYILKVEGRRAASAAPYAGVQLRIERELHQMEYERLFEAWIDRLKKYAYIKVFEDVRGKI
ncbi:MAG: peptidyl-prolyl cis-trans isomerase [Kiritimatiellae bacterium]|nr:peptidyl-prolyl cis-trans isomerase [Kiritimatiellia bacterium]